MKVPETKTFDELRIGDSCIFTRSITDADIKDYAQVVGDHNPLHIDEDYGKNTQFRGRIVHGMFLASQFSTLVGMYLPGKNAVYLSQDLKFLQPVRVGETITVRGEVTEKIESLRVVILKTEIFSERGEKAVAGMAKVIVLEPYQEALPKGEDVEFDLSGKVALISGASRGIGAATALLLGRHRAKIVVNYRQDEDNAASVVERIRDMGGLAYACKADVSKEKEVEEMLKFVGREAGGPVNILVNNASSGLLWQPFTKTTWGEFQRELDVMVKGSFHLIQGVLGGMLSMKSGKIVNVITTATMSAPPSNLAAYITAKSALSGLSKALAVELGPQGIQVNMVSPGLTETSLTAHFPRRYKDVVAAQTPLKRIASPDDIAKVILFLVSDASDFMTGVSVPVCGGHVMY